MPWFRMAPIQSKSAIVGDCDITTVKINDGAVTYAKIQDVSGAKLLGRYDSASGIVQEIALGSNLSFDSDSGVLVASATGVGDCDITTAKLADCAVDSTKLADSAVSADGLADSAVITAKITDCAVTGPKIADSGVVYGKIADSAVYDDKIADCGVRTTELKDSAVTNAKLADSAVNAAKMSDCAVTNAKLGDSAVSGVKIADSAVGNGEIADSAITSPKISDCAVIAAKLGDTAVITSKINANAVTSDKMYDSNTSTRVIEVHVTDTTLTVGDTAATFFVPAELDGYDLVRAEAAVKVASTAGRPTINIRNVTDSVDMLVNKITIDSGEKTSFTSDTASSIDTTKDTLESGDEIAIDIDSAGNAEDLYVILSVKKP